MGEIGLDGEKINHFFSGECSEEDSLFTNETFCNDDVQGELKHLLLKQFYELPEDDRNKRDLDHILYKIHYDINTKNSVKNDSLFSKFVIWSVRIAGVIILPLVVLWGIKGYLNNTQANETWIEIVAPAWTRVQFTLPDGTVGWLNSNSRVKYNGNFINDRHVTLTGEVFFDVYKDKKRPFTVTTKDVNVNVLGTRFNIASYENERNIEVVLEEGKLIFNDNSMNKPYMMSPNDLVTYDKTTKIYSTEVVQTHKYLSWTEGKLVFRNDPLDVIARRLERWYNVDVEINGCLNEDLRWRATFIDDSLEEVLDLLKRSLPVDYRIKSGGLNSDETATKKRVIITLNNE